ncbi:fumarylacetoacetate hydrolase family protein [Gordonia sp. UBA7599]|uniref:2-keto-4-pentenoate hydratase n=1 Tax=unclassified Gordonia (in: high G+C Gram-positive bacteria) TaxID=2657482 RepID=UPI000F951A1E|nr:fumarylacetoacetate hydrolase family protein [Gordonia sp. UBA7599]RUP38616.1 MAG: 2-keto-4-pentenoate hydratase [Gordonia sp. (in: high G+C Gram-positive bacteria)]HNP56222.1 fumarylacetoacetate hydrolase family protein [Gordonia sp. (in: high G+C Gram-positive bacteria)]
MTTTNQAIAGAAERLRSARLSHTPCAPVRELIDANDVHSAYAVQQLLTADRLAAGGHVVGRKIGLTSSAVQQQLGVDQPDFGVLFADMDASTSGINPALLLQPKVEAEVAFILGEDLDSPTLDLTRVKGAVESSWAALEIVDSRIVDWDIRFADTVADNGSAALFVIGDRLPDDVAPVDVSMSMTINGDVVSTGNGAACLGDPLKALLWLAQTARDLGQPLTAGQVILSGALGPMASLATGDRVEAGLYLAGEPVATVMTQVEAEDSE